MEIRWGGAALIQYTLFVICESLNPNAYDLAT
jgi:hypothetical protein